MSTERQFMEELTRPEIYPFWENKPCEEEKKPCKPECGCQECCAQKTFECKVEQCFDCKVEKCYECKTVCRRKIYEPPMKVRKCSRECPSRPCCCCCCCRCCQGER